MLTIHASEAELINSYGVGFHHQNVGPHMSLMIPQEIGEFDFLNGIKMAPKENRENHLI